MHRAQITFDYIDTDTGEVCRGIGPLCAVVIWAEVGDASRFHNAGQVVRLAGIDVSVWSSAGKRSPGRLVRQGPPLLRWALYEAGKSAARPSSPGYPYYTEVKARLDGKRAALSVARKLARRCYHTLRELGDQALTLPSSKLPEACS